MSLEARMQFVEDKSESLEYAFRENNKILEATHGVVSLILNEQRDMRKEQYELKQDFKRLEKHIDSRISELELLIRQHFTQS